MKSSREEREEDLQAELGYRTAGQRELALRDWYSLREPESKAGATSKAFDRLVAVLRAKKWAKEHPERRREIELKYSRKPGVSARNVAQARRRRRLRFIASNPAIKCDECGAEFCAIKPPRGGHPRRFCTERCGYLNLQRRNRRATGQSGSMKACSVCREFGHNARRHS